MEGRQEAARRLGHVEVLREIRRHALPRSRVSVGSAVGSTVSWTAESDQALVMVAMAAAASTVIVRVLMLMVMLQLLVQY
jgi:hypothetical protein